MRAKKTLLLAGLACTLLVACHSTDSTSLARSNSGETYAAPAGTTRTFMQNTQPVFQIGDRVSVQKGVMQRY